MYLMTCTRPELAYPLGLLARHVAPGRHRKVHMDAAKRVLRYLCSTSGMGLVLGGRGDVVLTGHSDASWRSTRSSSVLGSSCEAEIYATAMAAQLLRWLTYLLTDLGERPRSPPQRGQLRLAYVATRANIADIFTKALPPGDHQPCFALLVWPSDPLFSPTLPMGRACDADGNCHLADDHLAACDADCVERERCVRRDKRSFGGARDGFDSRQPAVSAAPGAAAPGAAAPGAAAPGAAAPGAATPGAATPGAAAPGPQQPPLAQPPLVQPPLEQPPLVQAPLVQPPLEQQPLERPPLAPGAAVGGRGFAIPPCCGCGRAAVGEGMGVAVCVPPLAPPPPLSPTAAAVAEGGGCVGA
ncbi:unnamed protein product [Closterium sp. NIES-53]